MISFFIFRESNSKIQKNMEMFPRKHRLNAICVSCASLQALLYSATCVHLRAMVVSVITITAWWNLSGIDS